MKISLTANVSVNGKVLLVNTPNYQAPQEAINAFMQIARQAGNLVIGRKTYEIFKQFFSDPNGIFSGLEIIILSTKASTSGYLVISTPEEAIRYLATKGFKEIVVGGGTEIYNAFLNKDLITDIYFNINPIIAGNTGELGTNQELASRFRLAETKVVAENIIQVHWTK